MGLMLYAARKLIVRRSRLRAAGDRAFGAAVPRLYGTAYQPTLPLHSRWKLLRNG